ncbi:hypothetical protein AaE_012017, partial [Aphanomyces astaci]
MDLVPIQAPRLTGTPLKVFSKLTRFPGLGNTVLKKIKKDNNFQHVREFASTLGDVMPVYVPLQPPSAEVLAEHTQLAASFSIEALADTSIDVKD